MSGTRYYRFLVIVAVLLLVVLPVAHAEILVPSGATTAFVQTSGRMAALGVGDFRTNALGDDSPHEIGIMIACTPGVQYAFQLFDPAVDAAGNWSTGNPTAPDGTRRTIDEERPFGSPVPDATHFTLRSPNGTPIATRTYTSGQFDAAWDTLATVTLPAAPVAGVDCGLYTLITTTGDGTATVSTNDDDNAWRFRLRGGDGTAPEAFNPALGPDGIAGTGDESAIGFEWTSFQHESTGCQIFYYFVDDGLPNVFMRNFDLDLGIAPGNVTYTMPNGTVITGTNSANAVWNQGTTPSATRPSFGDMALFDGVGDLAGDAMVNPPAGLWSAQICLGDDNQYSFEVSSRPLIFLDQPQLPNVTLAKTDGVTTVTSPGSTTYTLSLANTGPGAAMPIAGPEVVDQLPAGMTFTSCAVNAPLVGTCSHVGGGRIEFQLGPQAGMLAYLPSGGSGTLSVTAGVSAGLADGTTLTNSASADWTDIYGNNHAPVTADDTDTVSGTSTAQPNVTIAKTDGVTQVNSPGATTYTLTLTNTGGAGAVPVTGPEVVDQLPAGMTFASCAVNAPLVGTCSHVGGGQVEFQLTAQSGTTAYLPAGTSGTLTLGATVNAGLALGMALTNNATVNWTDDGGGAYPPGQASDTDTVAGSAGGRDPLLVLNKTDGVAEVSSPGSTTYTLTLTNVGAGDALPVTGPEVVDQLPTGMTFTSCAVNAPLVGTCSHVGGGRVEVELTAQPATTAFLPGAGQAPNNSGTITISAAVDAGLAPGTVLVNRAAATWTDSAGNTYTPVQASDTDRVPGGSGGGPVYDPGQISLGPGAPTLLPNTGYPPADASAAGGGLLIAGGLVLLAVAGVSFLRRGRRQTGA